LVNSIDTKILNDLSSLI